MIPASEDPARPGPRPIAIGLYRVRLDRVDGLRSARETIADREVILVEVTDVEGHVGWGECPTLPRPGYTAEYTGGAWAVLRDVLVPTVVAEPASALEYLAGVPGHQMARSGLLGALVDLDLRAAGRSLASVLAAEGPVAERVPATAVIGIEDSPGELEAAVARSLGAGHRSIKIKIDPSHDVDAVRVVRSQWPDLALAVDANGSYPDADTAARALRPLERVAGELTYIEQPLTAHDLVGSAVLARRLDTPIALDESITSVGEAFTALSLGAMGVLNVKPARVGGPLEAMATADAVAAEGCAVFCGGMVESGIGRAAALAFAAQPVCSLPTDLGPSARYHRRDVTEPFELIDGSIRVPTGPGIGVAPDLDILAAHTTATWHST